MMPAVFAGHGNPMYAITDNPYAREWRALGRALPKPKAVLAISAHWYVDEMAVTSRMHPETIHDFGGFPHELYQVRYPAPGDPELAARVRDRLAPLDVKLDAHWGLDHGTWSVLRHVFPDADVPVVQLAIDARRPPEFHFEVGQRLQPFREEGVLVFGSGNVVHNLQLFSFAPAAPFDWALRFETRVRELVEADDPGPLVRYETLGRDAELSVPTPDHYLPLLYVLGSRSQRDRARFPVAGIDGGSISMLATVLDEP